MDPVEILRSAVEERWNHGDVEGFMEPFAEDAELQPEAAYPDGGATITGKAEITRFFSGIHRPVELGPMVEFRGEVMCSFRWLSSEPTGFDWTLVYGFEGERIVRARYYSNSRDAGRALGLLPVKQVERT